MMMMMINDDCIIIVFLLLFIVQEIYALKEAYVYLGNLTLKEIKKFKMYLQKEGNHLMGLAPISNRLLDDTVDDVDIVKLMDRIYGKNMVQIIENILREMDLHGLIKHRGQSSQDSTRSVYFCHSLNF